MIIIPSESNHQEAKQMATNKAFNGKTMLNNGSGQYAGNLAELLFKDALSDRFLEHEYTAATSYHFDFKIVYFPFDHFLKSKIGSECKFEIRMCIFLFLKKFLSVSVNFLKSKKMDFPLYFQKVISPA